MLNEREVVERLQAASEAVRRAAAPTEFTRVQRAYRRRLAVRSVTAAAAVALITVGAVLGAVAVSNTGHAGRGASPTAPSPTGSRAVFHPQAAQVQPGGTGVVVGSTCTGTRCTFAALDTADGGRAWTAAQVPTAPLTETPEQLLTSTANDRWAAVPGLFATHDGGHSWTQLDTGGQVVAAAAAPSGLWVARRDCPAPGRCKTTLLSAPATGGSLEPLGRQPPMSDAGVPQLVRPDSTTGYLLDSAGRLAVTRDGGASWDSWPLPCPIGEGRGFAQLAADSPTSLWLACYPPGTGASGGHPGVLYRSTDGGRAWQQRGTIAGLSAMQPALVPFDATTAWIIDAAGQLRRTTDNGRTWQTAAPLGNWDALAINPSTTHDAAVVALPLVQQANTAMVDDPHANYTVFVTDDAGQHWTAAGTLPRETGTPSATPGARTSTPSAGCIGGSIDYGAAAHGERSATAALRTYLASRPARLPSGGWHVAERSNSATTFSSGAARIEVSRFADGSWLVTAYRTC